LGTLKSLWDAASGTFTNALVNLGEAIAPEVKALVQWAGDLSAKLGAWAKDNPALAHGLMKTAAVLAITVTGLGALTLAAAAVLGPLAALKFAMIFLGIKGFGVVSIIKTIGTVFMWLGRVLLMNPLGLAITLLATAAFLIYKNWAPIKEFFVNLWDGVTQRFNIMVEFIKDKLAWLKPMLAAVGIAVASPASAQPVKIVTRPPVVPASMRPQPAAAVQTNHFTIHAAPGMNEQHLSKLVSREFEKINRQQAANARSRLTDRE
jgi:phage-related minor tail protein